MKKTLIVWVLIAAAICIAAAGTPKVSAVTNFSDVPQTASYYDEVLWAVDKGIISGTSATTFSPNKPCTRYQFAQMLYKFAGRPAVLDIKLPFTDVSTDASYYKAVCWAYSNKIISGTSAATFSPNKEVTRYQAVQMLYKMAGKPAVSGTLSFEDVPTNASYYKAILWAVKKGITKGTSAEKFSPNAKCLRYQVVVFLYKYNNLPGSTSHKHSYTSLITTQPTCTKAGVKTYTCSTCGDSYTESIPATGHSYVVVSTEAYCEQTVTTCRCSKCNNEYTEVRDGGKGHTWELSGETPATCVTDGYKSYICIECYETKDEIFPATGVHREWSKVEKAATCTEDGMMYYQCYDCRAERREVIKATGHDFSIQNVSAWPTIFDNGSYTMTCSRCGSSDGSAHTLQQCTYSYNDEEEARFVTLMNQERTDLGLMKMFELDDTHCSYADEKAKYITADFSHDAWTIYGSGECIAGDYASAESVLNAWKTSSAQWEILTKAYDNCICDTLPVGVSFITVYDPNEYTQSCGAALDTAGHRFDSHFWVFNIL